MTDNIISIYKPLGWTPKEAIDRLRKLHPEYKDVKMGYAGRLDPMAEGVLLVLAGDATKRMDEIKQLGKTYRAEIVFGIETDSFDMLGVPNIKQPNPKITNKQIEALLKEAEHGVTIPIPPYSAYRVQGRPLFWWARQRRLSEIELPHQHVSVHDYDIENLTYMSGAEIRNESMQRTAMVQGDFRQTEIAAAWKNVFSADEDLQFPKVSLRIACGTGTYVRGIACWLGEELSAGAVLYRLVRTQVGEYTDKEATRLT